MKFISQLKGAQPVETAFSDHQLGRSRGIVKNSWSGVSIARDRIVDCGLAMSAFRLLTLFLAVTYGIAAGAESNNVNLAPWWKIGRAIVEWRSIAPAPNAQTRSVPVLKLSLRNEGAAGQANVQIFGRWIANNAAASKPLLLGTYAKEVALTRTSILDVSLLPLASNSPPTGKVSLEITITTSGKESDRKLVAWN